jgi:hypothetical protein
MRKTRGGNHLVRTSAVVLFLLVGGGFQETLAGHGCIRIPMHAAKEFTSFLPIGLEVVVYNDRHSAHAQSWVFTADDIEYKLELPSPEWHVVSRLDVHHHVEFIYGNDVANGHLQIRKILSDRARTAAELFSRDEQLEFKRLAGYVVCSECMGSNFEGHLSGAVFSYEYVSGGKPMYGRVYYLQLDKWTFYSLRFTASRDNLPFRREQMDFIAKSFRIK